MHVINRALDKVQLVNVFMQNKTLGHEANQQ